MRLFLVLCFVAVAWAKKNDSAPVAHSLFPGFGHGFPIFPGPFPPIGPPIYPLPPRFPQPGGYTCPNYPPTPISGCKIECDEDAECPGGKCCNYGCSSICVTPPTPATPPPTTTAETTTAATTATTGTTPTTAAPTTPTPAPTPPPQPFCPAGPSDSFCRQQCYYPCFGSRCNHCVVRCRSNYDCFGGKLCCLDAGCNMLCTTPVMSG